MSVVNRVLLFLVLTINPFEFVSAAAEACDTPKNESGVCIPLPDCKELFQLLKKRPVSPASILYLQDSTCDINGPQPRVCCPKPSDGKVEEKPSPNPSPVKTEPAPEEKKPRPAPTTNDLLQQDITAHRSFNLLPNVSECGKSVNSDRIIGGQDAGLGVYPWMALLGFSADDEPVQYACGGTLINDKYILTAAHCVTNLPYGYKLQVVRLGEYDQRTTQDCEKVESGAKVCAPPVQDMEIEEIIAHEDYDKQKSRENDIALIRLKKHAALGPFVSPVCIPHGERLQKVNSKEGNRVIVAGWGRLAYDSPDSAPVLQYVKLGLVSMDECNRFYAHKENFGEHLDNGRFCAGGEEGMDSCKGDSGGPLMMPLRPKSLGGPIRIFQLGVVSLGPSRCGHAGQPALYTKISEFLTWILDHLHK